MKSWLKSQFDTLALKYSRFSLKKSRGLKVFFAFVLLSACITAFQNCSSGFTASGSSSDSSSPDSTNNNDTGNSEPNPVADGGTPDSYDCTEQTPGPELDLSNLNGVGFKRTYIQANDCAIISEKFYLDEARTSDATFTYVIYDAGITPDKDFYRYASTVIPAGYTESETIRIDLSKFKTAKMITIQIVQVDPASIGISSIGNLLIHVNRRLDQKNTFLQIAAGQNHACGLLSDFSLACWGEMDYGQPFTLDPRYISRPFRLNTSKKFKFITTGDSHTCAIENDNTVSCWGSNSAGQLGNGTNDDAGLPTPVKNLGVVKSIDAYLNDTCAVLADNSVMCWGQNISSNLPKAVAGLSNVDSVTLGRRHACAILKNGAVSCWGANQQGQLGDGTNNDSESPVVVNLVDSAKKLALGDEHSCAIRVDDTAVCWGRGIEGQLGDGPTNKLADQRKIKSIEAQNNSTCAVLETGKVMCWGENGYGQLGDGTQTNTSSGVFANGTREVSTITMGTQYTCALKDDGSVGCWGLYNLANGSVLVVPKPEESLILGSLKKMVSGWGHGCATLTDDSMRCWGTNLYGSSFGGQLGVASISTTNIPVTPTGISKVKDIAVGSYHSCALLMDGKVKCFGNNRDGQLGNGTKDSTHTPTEVLNLSNVKQIYAAGEYTCAQLSDLTMYCWGHGYYGIVGNPSTSYTSPVQITEFSGAKAAAVGAAMFCIIKSDDSVICRGNDSHTPLGFAKAIAIGDRHACAILADDTVSCWGDNDRGQLGNNKATNHSYSPVAVPGLTGVKKIFAGEYQTCAILNNGGSKCWGEGPLNDDVPQTTPTLFSGAEGAISFSLGRISAVKLSDSRVMWWGHNYNGALGRFYMMSTTAFTPIHPF